MHTTALPDYIDKDLYDNLMALAEPGERREKYIADLTANLPEDAKDAAISRLDDAISHARALFEKGHVVSAEEWVNHDKQREIAGKVPPAPTKRYYAEAVYSGNSASGRVEVGMWVLHLTEGYFRRDIMRAVAKPGWFDE